MDHDLAMLEEKFVTIIDVSSNEEKVHYKTWERPNRLSLMLMRMTVADNIKTTLPKLRHFQKDCLKCKSWFEKNGELNTHVCFESNLIVVSHDT